MAAHTAQHSRPHRVAKTHSKHEGRRYLLLYDGLVLLVRGARFFNVALLHLVPPQPSSVPPLPRPVQVAVLPRPVAGARSVS
eukprot:3097534-Rhodomonas_salina.1